MNNDHLRQICTQLTTVELERLDELAEQIKKSISSPEGASDAITLLLGPLEVLIQVEEIGETGACTTVRDPELAVAIVEILQHCLTAGGDLALAVDAIAKLHRLDKRESAKSKAELYLQYRASALLDDALAQNVQFSDEAIRIILATGNRYVSDHSTQEMMCSMYWRLADRGVNISPVIQALSTAFHNHETDELATSSLLALWAAVRNGYFDTPIPDSDKTQRVWLPHIIGAGTYKLKKKDAPGRLGIIGCLIAIASQYPETRSVGREYLEKCKIREPKRPTNDFQHDLRAYFRLLCM